jgi:putative FmdB family regulatory protein
MPIYAYRCSSCGHAKDILRKLSDPPLTVCPVCGAPTFDKQVTAAGFQLKGSGWYVTDFKGGSSSATAPAAPAGEGGAKSDGKSDSKSDAAPAAPATPTAPATGTTGISGDAK